MLDKRKKSRWGEGLGCMRAGVGYCGSVGEQWSGCAGYCGVAGSGMARGSWSVYERCRGIEERGRRHIIRNAFALIFIVIVLKRKASFCYSRKMAKTQLYNEQ